MTRLEILYVTIGVGIVLRGVIDHGLTVTELGAAMFFIGLVPVTRADKASPEASSVISTITKWFLSAPSQHPMGKGSKKK